jgi:hypothetical protein
MMDKEDFSVLHLSRISLILYVFNVPDLCKKELGGKSLTKSTYWSASPLRVLVINRKHTEGTLSHKPIRGYHWIPINGKSQKVSVQYAFPGLFKTFPPTYGFGSVWIRIILVGSWILIRIEVTMQERFRGSRWSRGRSQWRRGGSK